MARKYETCAYCGGELGNTYYTITDNFLIFNYFDELDGSDNAFCCESCVAAAVMTEEYDNKA